MLAVEFGGTFKHATGISNRLILSSRDRSIRRSVNRPESILSWRLSFSSLRRRDRTLQRFFLVFRAKLTQEGHWFRNYYQVSSQALLLLA